MLISDVPYEPFYFGDLGCPKEPVIYIHRVWTARDEDDEMNKECLKML
jgi:hypothetical protein